LIKSASADNLVLPSNANQDDTVERLHTHTPLACYLVTLVRARWLHVR